MLLNLCKTQTNRQLLSLLCLRQRHCIRCKTTGKRTWRKRTTGASDGHSDVVSMQRPIDHKMQNNDYLGVLEAKSEDISGSYDGNGVWEQTYDKYKDLFDKRMAVKNEQHFVVTSFGKVRLDSDNEPTIHGQYDPDNTRPKFDINAFEASLQSSRQSDQSQPESETRDDFKGQIDPNVDTCVVESKVDVKTRDNLFEDQYFGVFSDSLKSVDPKCEDNVVEEDNNGVNFIERQFFDRNIEPMFKRKIDFKFSHEFHEYLAQKAEEVKTIEKNNLRRGLRQMPTESVVKSDDSSHESPLKPEFFAQTIEENNDFNVNNDKNNVIDDEIQKKIDEQMDIKLEDVNKKTVDYSRPTQRTGAQYLDDIQSGKVCPNYPKLFTTDVKDFRSKSNLKGEKLDSKGYRVLSGQVFDYTTFTHEDIVELLLKSVIFNDVDIVAINKPYGLSIHTKDVKSGPVLTEYLPKLVEAMDCEQLYTVHRLDKDTTGVLLLAKTQEMAKRLNQMFANHEIVKRYFCITRGVPEEPEGLIDIPLEIGRCDGRERMALRPEVLEEYRHVMRSSKSAKRAVTQYKVFSHSGNAALVEVWPKTGVRHQIRAHLGLGLRCPILGDHKYSHLDRLAPQKLTGDMLLGLNVRQSKVRHIPMHLHARQYLLPGAGRDHRNIFINAPFPHHFHQNLSKLRLRV